MLSITHALLGTTDTYTFGLLGHIVTSVEKFLTRLQACGAGGRGGEIHYPAAKPSKCKRNLLTRGEVAENCSLRRLVNQKWYATLC